jgi:hypothetical protein
MKLLIIQFSQTSCQFISIRSKYSPQHRLLKTLSVCVPPPVSETKFPTHTEPRAKLYILYILMFTFLDSRREGEGFWTEW